MEISSTSYDAFEQARLMHRLTTPYPFANFQNAKIITEDLPDIEATYLQKMLMLYAMIPNMFTQDSGYKFHAECCGDKRIYLQYVTTDETSELCAELIGVWQDELIELINDGVIDASFDEGTQTFCFYSNEDLLLAIDETQECLEDIMKSFANVLSSSAHSIYAELIESDPQDDCDYDISTPHMAIVKALKTIASTFPDTQDFTVTPTQYEGSDLCRISLGKNSDISFEKRYRALRDIYDEIDAILNFDEGMNILMAPDETEVAIMIYDPQKAARALCGLFDDLDVQAKANKGEARLFITKSELYTACNEPTEKALKFQAFQH